MQKESRVKYLIVIILGGFLCLNAQNPIVANKGLNDPHIHIFNDTAYVYASHDKSIQNDKFIMNDWWIWSSPDLVNWKKRSVLKPEDTYIGKPFSRCWATDAAYRNNKYYWYFSEGNAQTGVVVGDTPIGPWKDVLKKPLLPSGLTDTHEYDMAVFEDNGEHYIIFGVWEYYIARLNRDMVSLAETPQKIEIKKPRGPYNLDGTNKLKPTDDKPFVHKYNGNYYLSWGCFYAMSNNLYGPYTYKDSVIKTNSFAEGYDEPTWPTGFKQGRHGSFFEWHNQWYFIYCDISQTGNRYFRDSFISYVHYKANGEIETIRVDGQGVANYNAKQLKIEAEDFFKAKGFKKIEFGTNFAVKTTANKSYFNYPNVKNLKNKKRISLNVMATTGSTFKIEIRKDHLNGTILGENHFTLKPQRTSKNITIKLSKLSNKENIFVLIEQLDQKNLAIDNFSFLN